MATERFFHLSETSAGVQFGNLIDPALHSKVMRAYHFFRQHPFPGFVEAVPAYASLSVYFDPLRSARIGQMDADGLLEHLNAMLDEAMKSTDVGQEDPSSIMKIPVCYHPLLASDLEWTAEHCGLGMDELIALHTGTIYTVYMLGFVPGFPYLGILPEGLEVPRKSTPSESIPAGSVALAGRQTGIYPISTPGGWQVIGRTPILLFDPGRDPSCLLKPGDRVQFESITLHEFFQISQT